MAHGISFNHFLFAPGAQDPKENVFSSHAIAEGKDGHTHFFNIVENKGIADRLSTATGIHDCSESSHLSCCEEAKTQAESAFNSRLKATSDFLR